VKKAATVSASLRSSASPRERCGLGVAGGVSKKRKKKKKKKKRD
jgi:hypothetical protein